MGNLEALGPKVVPFPISNPEQSKEQFVANITQQFHRADPTWQRALLSELNKTAHIFQKSISSLIPLDENQKIEFKETFSVATKNDADGKAVKADVIRLAALKEIAGFLNSNDGTLLIGVADGKNTDTGRPEIRGIAADNFSGDRDKYARTILDLALAAFGTTTVSKLAVSFEEFGTKTVCRIDCSKSLEPVYCNYKNFKDKPFVRYGSSTIEPIQKEWLKWVDSRF